MRFWRASRRLSGVMRFGAIGRVLIRHGLGDLVERLFMRPGKKKGDPEPVYRSGYPSPIRIRRVLEELGPSFIKLGQLMSTRADIFPPEYIEELKKLQDSVPPVPFPEILSVIEEELRRPLSQIFADFSPEPLAAASVAQVHIATLFSGEKVAVKVVRPGIAKKIRDDIGLMFRLAGRIESAFEIGRILGILNIVREFERTVFKELDMLIEAGNIERFNQNFKDSSEIHIPKVYWEYTTRSILTMERIEGIKMDQVDAIRGRGIDPEAIAMIGLRSFSRQLMEFGLFHADPHPGNTIVMFDGRVSLIDFGIIGHLDAEAMHQIANVFLGYAEHDYDIVIDALSAAGILDASAVDLKSFRADLEDASEPFYGRSLKTISVRDVYDQLMQLVLKYRIRLPRNLLLLLKTFIQTEALGKILGSEASLLEITRPYATALLERGYETRKVFREMGKDVASIGGYFKAMPRYLHDILRQTAHGKQKVEIRHTGFQRLETQLEKGVNRFTVGIVISASIIGAALILGSSQKVFEISIPFLGVVVSVTALLGLIGYTIATVLGIWLIISILRSGRL